MRNVLVGDVKNVMPEVVGIMLSNHVFSHNTQYVSNGHKCRYHRNFFNKEKDGDFYVV
jgi:hypothetical protein